MGTLKGLITGLAAGGQGGGSLMSGVMGWMGVMSLFEAKKIWDLKEKQQLHLHPLFETARSWRTEERDSFGVVNRINTSEFDDKAPLMDRGNWDGFCCNVFCPPALSSQAGGESCLGTIWKCCCPCFSAAPPGE